MLDITLESSTHNQSAGNPAAQRSPTARSLADRRTTATLKSSAPSTSPRRRRHDNLNTGKQTPLEW
jgi:hypothetical protein